MAQTAYERYLASLKQLEALRKWREAQAAKEQPKQDSGESK